MYIYSSGSPTGSASRPSRKGEDGTKGGAKIIVKKGRVEGMERKGRDENGRGREECPHDEILHRPWPLLGCPSHRKLMMVKLRQKMFSNVVHA